MMVLRSSVLVILFALGNAKAYDNISIELSNREHRGAWIATVVNIDWPRSPNSPTNVQQSELKFLISQIRRAGLNAVYFQVRPTGDALYRSNIEPWSRYLTGEEGRAPSPAWDPLQYLINICRPLGIEVHAWINPYRANMSPTTSNVAENHMARMYPEYAYVYDTYLWMDPGAEVVQNRTASVALDLVNRYDLAGLHMDDYFYPYPVAGWVFPDNNTYAAYLAGGGTMEIDDWRRDNVNTLIQRLNTEIHNAKPWVKFSVSPFGIYRPGHPDGMPPPIAGFDQFSQIYCDPKLWLQKGWVDILQPQLYWRIDPPAQSYPILLNWWIAENQNPLVRHVMAGNYLSRVDFDDWELDEIRRQVDISRESANRVRGSWGNIMFSSKIFCDNIDGAVDYFRTYIYPRPALQPEYPWLTKNVSSVEIPAPKVTALANGGFYVGLDHSVKSSLIHQIAIYEQKENVWRVYKVFPVKWYGTDKKFGHALEKGSYVATLVDRFGREGKKTYFEM